MHGQMCYLPTHVLKRKDREIFGRMYRSRNVRRGRANILIRISLRHFCLWMRYYHGTHEDARFTYLRGSLMPMTLRDWEANIVLPRLERRPVCHVTWRNTSLKSRHTTNSLLSGNVSDILKITQSHRNDNRNFQLFLRLLKDGVLLPIIPLCLKLMTL